jgi:hypothetical protein
MVSEEVFVNCDNFNYITKVKKGNIQGTGYRILIKLSGARTVGGAEIRICGSVEPEPKEIFSAPQHC